MKSCTKLVEGRIQYLKTSKLPIAYHPSNKTEASNTDLKTRFFVYVEETGMRYEDFESLVPARVRNAALAEFARPNARLEDQLTSLMDYQDLISTSPWVQHRVVELLSRSDVREAPEAKAVFKLIVALARAEKSKAVELAADSTSAIASDTAQASLPEAEAREGLAATAMRFVRRLKSANSEQAHSVSTEPAPLVFTQLLKTIRAQRPEGATRTPRFVSATCQAIFD